MYFLYEPDWKCLSLGIVSAMREIQLAREVIDLFVGNRSVDAEKGLLFGALYS